MKTKNWEDLTFADNFMFCMILEHNPDLCRKLIELLLHIRVDRLEVPQVEKTVRENFDSKSVRFDVYVKDEKRIFDLEMQVTDTRNLPKRARYYQSIIDVENLSRGENYARLKDSYVIFICMEDVFKEKLPVYFFENTCRSDGSIKLNDRTFKVFFNAESCDKLESAEEKDFFNFLKGNHARTGFSKELEEKVENAKKNNRWRRQYMTWQQTIDEEKEISFEEGISKGSHDKAVETARKLLEEGIPLSTVLKCTGLTEEDIAEVSSVKKQHSVV